MLVDNNKKKMAWFETGKAFAWGIIEMTFKNIVAVLGDSFERLVRPLVDQGVAHLQLSIAQVAAAGIMALVTAIVVYYSAAIVVSLVATHWRKVIFVLVFVASYTAIVQQLAPPPAHRTDPN